MRSSRFTFWLGMLMILTWMLAACTSEPIKQQHTAPTEAPPESVEDIEEGQTITLVTPDTATKAPEEKNKYQIHTRLTDFHLINESVGIAWGITDTALRLYKTEDNGDTWVDIFPSSNVQFMDKLEYGKEIVFTDKNHGWIVRNKQRSTETILLNTTNGGETWKLSSLPRTGAVSGMSFVSSREGWIMAKGELSLGAEEKTLFLTRNNGESWEEVMQNSEYPISRIPGSVIPRTGSVMGLMFTDPNVGFVTIREMQYSKLYITRDGGQKWKPSGQVFQSKRLNSCGSVFAGTPVFLGNGSNGKEVYIPVSCIKDDQVSYMGYFTADTGKSWNLVSFPMTGDPGQGTIPPVFYRLEDGFRMVNGIVYHSRNMGKTWTAFPKSKLLADNLKKYPNVVKLQFTSPDVGWMLIETMDKKRSRLMKTSNGGRSWQGI